MILSSLMRNGLLLQIFSKLLKLKKIQPYNVHTVLSLSSSFLKTCLQAFADSVSSQKRAAADGECREECLLQETASKEAAMATRIEEVQAELKQTRLALSNTHAEIDRLGVFSTQLKKVSLLLFPGISS